MEIRQPKRLALILAVGLGVTGAEAGDRPIGVVVESVDRNGAAAAAGLEPGDLILSWWLPGSDGGRSARNHLDDPLELQLAEVLHGPRGYVRLAGFRAGREFDVKVGAGDWGVEGRPQLSREVLPEYTAALEAARAGMSELAAGSARAMASEAVSEGERRVAAWLLQRVGSELVRAGANAEAAELYRQAVAALAPCPEAAVCALAHHRHAVVVAQTDVARAADAFQAALDHWSREAAGELGAAATRQAWADAFARAGDLDAAASCYRLALDTRRRLAPGRLAVAESRQGLAAVHLARGKLEAARREVEAAHSIVAKWASESLAMAANLSLQGELAVAEEDLELARNHFEAGLALVKNLTPGTAAEARISSRLGEVAERQDAISEAEDLYRRAAAILEGLGSEMSARSSCLEKLGRVLQIQGDLSGAAAALREAVAIRFEQWPQSPETARTMAALARVEVARGRGVEAREWVQRALVLYREVAPEAPAMVETLESLAGVDLTRGETGEAASLLAEALAHPLRAGSSGARAALLESMGRVASVEGDLEAATTWYRRALEVREEIGPSDPALVETMVALGRQLLEAGDLVEAGNVLEDAVAAAGRVAPGTLVGARAMRTLAEQLLPGDVERATDLCRDAVARDEILAPDSAELARSLHTLATALRAAGTTDEALAQATLAAAALERQKTSLAVTPERPARWWLELLPVFRELLDLLVESGRPEDAFRVLEQSHAWRMAVLMAGRELSLENRVSPEVARRWQMARASYRRAAARLAASSVPQAGEETPQEKLDFEEARRELSAARAAVASGAPGLVAVLEPGAVGVIRASELVGQGTLLLSWSVGEEHSYLFAIGPGKDAFAAHRLEVGRGALASDVERLRQLLETEAEGASELQAVANRLAGLLLAPVATEIDSAERLHLVADGPLRRLPFAVLSDRGPGGDPRYLVERAPLSETASVGLLGDLGGGRGRDQAPAILVVADPVGFPDGEGERSPAMRAAMTSGLRLEPLSGSSQEAESVASLFPDLTSTWTGERVTERSVAGIGRKPSVVHLGVRAFTDDRHPLESALLLSPPGGEEEGSGDGLLQAWEIVEGMRLDAFLVTLSRADSGGSSARPGAGEAVLTRALQLAGTPRVVLSSWEPDGPAVAELMRRFYSNLGRGLDTDQALREAQLELLRGPLVVGDGDEAITLDLTHPARWGGYRVVGAAR